MRVRNAFGDMLDRSLIIGGRTGAVDRHIGLVFEIVAPADMDADGI